MTKPQLIAKLTALGIQHDPDAVKADLEALLPAGFEEESDIKAELRKLYEAEKQVRPEVYEIQQKDKELERLLAKSDEEIAKVLGK